MSEGRSVGQTPIKVGVFNLEIEGLAAAMSPMTGEQKNCFNNMLIKQKFNFKRKERAFRVKKQSGDAATMID